jgi:YVTN family beta-propeller protein
MAPGTPSSNDQLQKTYVPSATDGTVTVIDQRTRAVVATIKVGSAPQYAAVDGQNGKVYVNNLTDRTVSVIDSATNAVVKTVASGAGTSANFGSVNAIYRRYYLPNAGDNTLTLIDTDTDTVVRTITVGTAPADAMADATTGDLYVANGGGNAITFINAATQNVSGSFVVGPGPSRIFELGDHLFALVANGANPDAVVVSTKQNTIVGTSIATEFYHAAFDHYFHTADETETRRIRDGLFNDDWHRTFEFWRVWNAPGPGRVAVCRFFSPSYTPKSSHFYTPYPTECASLAAGSVWQLESSAVFYLVLPDLTTGNCAVGTSPLYRLYNDSAGGAPNHRYTANRTVRDATVARGWIAEGSGPDVVFACTPTLLGG